MWPPLIGDVSPWTRTSFIKGILNINIRMSDLSCGMCYIKNSDWVPGVGWVTFSWFVLFNLHLDLNFREMPILKKEIGNFNHSFHYAPFCDQFGRKISQCSPIGLVQLGSRPNFQNHQEYQNRKFIAILGQELWLMQSWGSRWGSGHLLQMGWLYFIWTYFRYERGDFHISCYRCFNVPTLEQGWLKMRPRISN